MKIPVSLFEEEGIENLLISRPLLTQYKKAKTSILAGHHTGVFLKERNPKGCGIWYFRINRQYRAWCRWSNDSLIVFTIDDHS